jgi:predicted N-acetyltransferase YhbS
VISHPFTYRREAPEDSAWIEAMQAELFGPARFKRAAYVLREGVPPDPNLSLVALADGKPVASVRMTPILIGGRDAILLGPLIVAPRYRGQGAGRSLVRKALAAAGDAGHRVVLLVGDLPYYGPLGFTHLGRDVITLPAPVDPDRVLVAGLTQGALAGLGGPAESVRQRKPQRPSRTQVAKGSPIRASRPKSPAMPNSPRKP